MSKNKHAFNECMLMTEHGGKTSQIKHKGNYMYMFSLGD